MIRIYILHIEFHWDYWPKISIRRRPRHGQFAIDGGYPGTFKLCPTCQDGFLFEQHPLSKSLSEQQPLSPGPHTWDGSTCIECEADVSWCPYPPSQFSE